jgi:excisionase family DNA binding protein
MTDKTRSTITTLLSQLSEALREADVIDAPPIPRDDDLLSLDEARDVLGVSRPQIDLLVRHKGIPYTRVGGRKRILRGELMAWVKRQPVAA